MKRPPTFKPGWPLPDEYLLELGRVSAIWGSLESFLELCIAKLSGLDVNDMKWLVLIKHSSFPQKLDILKSLCDLLSSEHAHLRGYEEVTAKIKEAQALRNKLLHNMIVPSDEPSGTEFRIVEASARGKLRTSTKAINADDIRDACAKIHLANLALYKLVLQVEVAPVWERWDAQAGAK
jgi:hypothetical protein